VLKMIRQITLASCFLFLIAAAVAAQDFKIEPGRRIGKIELGASRAVVHQTLGKPSATYRAPGGMSGEVWMATTGNDVRIVYRNGRVVQIKATSSSFATPEGLTTKSSLAEVQQHYKNLVKISRFAHGSGGGLIDYYDDVRRGIAFEFTSVDSETPNFKPYAIVVHRPGQRVMPENDEEQIVYER
jgi:dUTPase